MVDGWLNRPRGTEPARPDMRAQGARAQDHGVIIRSHGEDCRRSVGDQQPGVSGPSSGKPALRLHLVMIRPGTPHLAVNGGDVTSIAVVARTDLADQPGAVVIELPRHLADLSSYPVR
jgi:hypothetical protein